jgi:integrase
VCGLRIGEVTALKVSCLDFRRKLIHITGALDYATRKESTVWESNVNTHGISRPYGELQGAQSRPLERPETVNVP